MPDAHALAAANALLAGTGTPSLVYGCPSRRAFRYPAHAASVTSYRKFFVLSSRLDWRMILGAGSGVNLVAGATRRGNCEHN
jgi:hypothetical protein